MASIKTVCALLVHLAMVGAVTGNVVLMGENVSKSFDDMEADFMGGTPDDIKIHAVFISKASGRELKEYTGHTDVETWILPTSENSPWSIVVVSFISLLVMSSVLATCFFG